MDARISFQRTSFLTLVCGVVAAASLAVTTPAHGEERRRDEAPPPSEPRERHSKTHIAVDFDFNSAFDELNTKVGGGGALRIGQKFNLLLISLTPEVGGSYHAFGGDDGTRLYSGFLGGRVGFGKIVEPSIFAHWGLAHLEGLDTRTGTVLDAGLALDVTLLPLVDFGVHGGYNVMTPSGDGNALKYMTFGAQAALVL
jgi:hypothetical protein